MSRLSLTKSTVCVFNSLPGGRATMRVQKRQRQRPGFRRRFGVVTRPRVAEKSVIGEGKLGIDPRLLRGPHRVVDRRNLLGPDVFVETAPEVDHGRADFVETVEQAGKERAARNTAAVV